MNTIKLALLSLSLASTVSLAGECTAPAKPSVPDGGTSSMEDMLAGQKAVKGFQTANLAYMACLEPQIAAARTELEAGDKSAADKITQLEETYNDAVSQEEEVAGQFNTEIREYKAANAK
jgi:hypothetical protein